MTSKNSRQRAALGPIDPHALYNEVEAAAILDLSVGTLRSWRFYGRGDLEYLKLSDGKAGPVRYTGAALIAKLERSRRGVVRDDSAAVPARQA